MRIDSSNNNHFSKFLQQSVDPIFSHDFKLYFSWFFTLTRTKYHLTEIIIMSEIIKANPGGKGLPMSGIKPQISEFQCFLPQLKPRIWKPEKFQICCQVYFHRLSDGCSQIIVKIMSLIQAPLCHIFFPVPAYSICHISGRSLSLSHCLFVNKW